MDLKKKRQLLLEQMQGITSAAIAANRVNTPEELKKLADLKLEVEAIDATLQASQDVAALGSVVVDRAIDGSGAGVQTPAVASATTPQGNTLVAAGQAPHLQVTRDHDAEEPFKRLGDQLRAIKQVATIGIRDPRLDQVMNKAAQQRAAIQGGSTQVLTDGGILIQQNFATELLKTMWDVGTLMPRVSKGVISGNSITYPTVENNDASTGSFTGGIIVYTTAEAAAYTASKPEFGTLDMKLGKLTALTYETDELADDAPAFESYCKENVPIEFSAKGDDLILNGSGTKEPQGIKNSKSLIVVAKESGQSANTLFAENIVKMWARIPKRQLGNCVWVHTPQISEKLPFLALTSGGNTVPLFMPPTGLSGSPYGTILGLPAIEHQSCAAFSAQGDIWLLNLSAYKWIDKAGITSAESIHVEFVTGQKCFRWEYRCDGRPMLKDVIKPKNGSFNQSPFVVLAAR